MAAQIGLHGSSIKVGELVAPAMQVVLGGGVDRNGVGSVGDKIIKLPTKRMPDALRILLNDYEANATEGEYFNDYYRRQGKHYFYTMLKPLADTKTFREDEFYDYGHEELFTPEVGVGECAGVMYDMIGTILKEASEKLEEATQNLQEGRYPEAIYYAYTGYIIAAKAILLSKDIECNTQIKILKDFDIHLTGQFEGISNLESRVLALQENEPDATFAKSYIEGFSDFLKMVLSYRTEAIKGDKLVVESAYKA
jgi:sulfite reductase (ferredoxin)